MRRDLRSIFPGCSFSLAYEHCKKSIKRLFENCSPNRISLNVYKSSNLAIRLQIHGRSNIQFILMFIDSYRNLTPGQVLYLVSCIVSYTKIFHSFSSTSILKLEKYVNYSETFCTTNYTSQCNETEKKLSKHLLEKSVSFWETHFEPI